MMRMESYGLAFLGSCLALLPISLAAIVTMPIGIWALVMLSSSEGYVTPSIRRHSASV
jgi:hypothetical protein